MIKVKLGDIVHEVHETTVTAFTRVGFEIVEEKPVVESAPVKTKTPPKKTTKK